MDLLSSMIDAGLAWAAAAAVLGMGLWMVCEAGIPSEASSSRPISTLREAPTPLRHAA